MAGQLRKYEAAADDPEGQSHVAEHLPSCFDEEDRVLIREGHRSWFVPVREIELLEAQGNHSRVYFGEERPLLYRPLQTLENRLPSRLFFRASRSHLINLRAIVGIRDGDNGQYRVTLRGGQEIQISRRQARAFREKTSL